MSLMFSHVGFSSIEAFQISLLTPLHMSSLALVPVYTLIMASQSLHHINPLFLFTFVVPCGFDMLHGTIPTYPDAAANQLILLDTESTLSSSFYEYGYSVLALIGEGLISFPSRLSHAIVSIIEATHERNPLSTYVLLDSLNVARA